MVNWDYIRFIFLFILGLLTANIPVYTQERILQFSHITVEHGLSQNTIHGIVQDKYGFMWFGTWAGLCKYDGYKFTVYRSDPDKPNTINNNRIHYIYKDHNEDIWLTSFDSIFYCRYNYETDDFTRIPRNDVPGYLKDSLNRRRYYYRYNASYKNTVWKVDQNTNLLYQTNAITGKTIQYKADIYNRWSLNDDYVTDLYIDHNEILWIGTFSGGINKASLGAAPFVYYHHSPSSLNSLTSNNIRGLAEDKEGNIWVGTRSDGITIIDRKNERFTQLKADRNNKNSLINNQVRKIFCDSYGHIWIGTKDGLDRYNPDTKRFYHYSWDTPKPIPHRWVYSMLEDHENNLWIGTWRGIAKYNRAKDEFYAYDVQSTLLYPWVRVILEDNKTKNLWIGTEGGGLTLLKREKIKDFTEKLIPVHYLNSPSNTNTLINDRIYTMYQDSNGVLWIGTGGGLCKFDPQKNEFFRFVGQHQLPDDMIMGILSDKKGRIWVSHKKGLTCIYPGDLKMRNYTSDDGLQGNEFNEDAYLKTSTNELFFGGLNGLNSFDPESITSNEHPPKIVFTNLYLFNKPVKVNQRINDRIVLSKSLVLTNEINILHSDKSFSIEFAALHYINPKGNRYKYKLQGFDNDWIEAGADQRIATYSNLKARKYEFQVLASNSDGVWTPNPKTLTIIVLPPWWATWWFRLFLFISLVVVIYGIYYLRISIYRNKEKELSILVEKRTIELKSTNELLIERQKHIEDQASELLTQTENLKETNDLLLEKQKFIQQQSQVLEEKNNQLSVLNATKDKFFSIIAHDLRNPFHTVMGFSELLLMSFEKMTPDKIRKYIQLIHSSSSAGNNLLENLLQWSRAQTGKISYEPVVVDLHKQLIEILNLMELSISKKNLTVTKRIEPNTFVFADPNMLQTILRNLITNAIKFSNENGEIIISIEQTDVDVKISVTDNGVGIPYDKQDLIFNIHNHYTTIGTKNEAGTGLGLVLCKEFVEKHEGKIWFESTPGKGSTFMFSLPQEQ